MQDFPILETINSPADLKELPREDLDALAAETRSFLIEKVSGRAGISRRISASSS
ncbi:MAG: hypothetical protein ILO42_06460 [Clostridia bacterium]|nr:hypothetical protein [Clostridia bacterium]